MVKNHFGKLAKPDMPIEKLYTVEPTQDGERIVNLRRTGEVPIIAAQYHIPGALHSDIPALQVLQEIMTDASRGRLQKKLVEPGIASGAGAWSYPRKDPSSLTFMANGFKDKSYDEMEATLLAVIEDVKSNKITEEEVTLAKGAILKSKEDQLRNVVSVGSQLTEYIAMGDYRYIFLIRDLIEKVTVEDVQRVAEKYLI
jgi:zinc protease